MKTIKYLFLFILTVSITCCDDYLDVNYDPSNPQNVPAETLLPPILQEMVSGEVFDSRFIGKYIQNWGEVTTSVAGIVWDQYGYQAGSDNGGQKWRSHYWSIGKNIDLMIDDAEVNKKWALIGVAKAIRAWSWQTTTDYHGELILTQAWEPNRYVFEYEAQSLVYQEVIKLCNEALEAFAQEDVTKTLTDKYDLVYKGDIEKWKKFVYFILARNAHHISNKPSYDPNKVIEYVDKSFAASGDDFSVPHTGSNTINGNFYGPIRNNLTPYRPTTYAINLMNGTTFTGVVDPRLEHMFTASGDGQFRGISLGVGDPDNGNALRQVPTLWGINFTTTAPPAGTAGKYIYKDNANFPLGTYIELQFMKAEAAFIKGDMATALTAYRNGIQAHLDFVGTTVASANVAAYNAGKTIYMNSAAVAQNTTQLTLSGIMLQKYIAMYGHGILETWVDMRRYHYEANIYTGFTLPAILFQANAGKPAYRVRPRFNSEYRWNRTALEEIGANNLDYHTYEQWFSTSEN